MNEEIIIHGARLKEILRDQLRQALCIEDTSASEYTEFYLVNLLSDYHVAGNALIYGDERPLGMAFMEALSKALPSKIVELKRIGDTTLVSLGLFPECVRRTIVAPSYYLSIGGSAYEALSSIVGSDSQLADVYAELSAKFPRLVTALVHLAPWNNASTDAEVLGIYRRWLESGDERLAEILKKLGILTRE